MRVTGSELVSVVEGVDWSTVNWSDVTASQLQGRIQWLDGGLDLPFVPEPTAAERRAILRRLMSANTNEETIRTRLEAASADLLAYESLASPAGLQTVTVVKLLCRVVRGLIRLQLRDLGGVD